MPDHSSLTRIRQRLGVEVFARFFEQITDRCQAAGLIWGRELSVDATKVAANADLDALVPRFSHAATTHVADRFADDALAAAATAEPEAAADPLPDGVVRLPNAVGDEASRVAPPPWRMREERRLAPDRPAVGSDRRTSDFWVSATDPDASPMRTGSGTALGYHDHYVVDGGKARIILAAFVTPADVMENVPMCDLLWRICFRRKLRPAQVTGDTTDGTVANIVAIEREHIRAYVPLSAAGQRAGVFSAVDFAYDPATDRYRCPAGTTLRFLSQSESTQRRIYQAPALACRTCALRAQCTTSPRGRRVSRSLDEVLLDRVRSYHATEAYQKAMRKRQVWVEPRFAEAKTWHGRRRFRLRGLEKVNSEALLIAAGQNLKRLLRWRGWGRRPFPHGSAGVVLPALPAWSTRTR